MSHTQPVFAGVGDGVTSNNTALTNAASAVAPLAVPAGTYASTLASSAITANLLGPGQVKDASGNKRAPIFSAITAAPASLGDEASVETAFNGSLSKVPFAIEYRITGAATLGTPASGYKYTPEATPNYTFLYNTSGHNQSLAGNGGRTAATAYRTRVYQAGQGDAVCYNASAFVTGAKAGATSFLANPAAVLFNGDMTAGAAGVYMNPYETYCTDGGFDAACVGLVNNFDRSVSTGALGVYWAGYRAQSLGAASIDNIISATGKAVVGLDFSMAALDFGANKAAISLKANDLIYLNNSAGASGSLPADIRTTVFNGDYIGYSTSINGILAVVGGVPALQMQAAQTTITNSLSLTGSGIGFFGTSPTTKPTVTGSRGGNAALTSLLTALATLGLITNSTTA